MSPLEYELDARHLPKPQENMCYLTAHFSGGKLDGKIEAMRIPESVWERGTLWATFRNGEEYHREIYRRVSDANPTIYRFECIESITPTE